MKRILIAEDESRIASFLAKGLHQNGFETAIARNGEQAIQMAQSGSFDLLLLDIRMPLKDGWSVLAELRTQQYLLPVIIVTVCQETQDQLAGFQNGANDYVTKPFRFIDLLERINTVLEIDGKGNT
jgi:DNA-binding response OmpR family regulator